ncbi:hypothetical protein E1286_10355 [Nonomuraea terrae]|uniref:MFS transporter n=1 Tax=Nonomuraea terrae TaxID=2530383 RepID=A0A4R4Z2H2_9ACTN|nr:hypothetical protein [Nonomuraea terrae]TDD51570.1 hypothetical protein E1286_10355 [Nonomuraea terrae]
MTPPLRFRCFLVFVLAWSVLSIVSMFADFDLVVHMQVDPRAVKEIGGSAATLALVLLGLPLGVLIDRARRRSAMTVVPLLVAAGGLSVLAADALGSQSDGHAIAVLTTMGVLTTVASVVRDACLPSIAGRERLVPANALLSVVPLILALCLASVLSLLDDLVDVTAPILTVTMASLAALLFRTVDAAEEPAPPPAGLRWEMTEAIRFTARHPVLRAIALYLVVSALVAEFADEVADEALRVAAESAAIPLGSYFSVVNLSALLVPFVGALLAVLLHRRVGVFRLACAALLVSQPFTLLLALSGSPGGAIWYVVGTLVPMTGTAVAALALLSHRQALTPDRLLGRVGGLLLALATLADALGELLETAATPPTLLPGVAVATLAALAAAVPLLRTVTAEKSDTPV